MAAAIGTCPAHFVVMASAAPAPMVQCVSASTPVIVMSPCWMQQPSVSVVAGVLPELAKQPVEPAQPPATAQGSSASDEQPKLTRGARRRAQQRIRKKLGKLERMKAACQDTESASAEVQDVPVPEIGEIFEHQSFDLPMFDLSIPTIGTSAAKIVPVCAVQQDVKLDEDCELEVADVFICLPGKCKGVAPVDSETASSAPETPRVSTPGTATPCSESPRGPSQCGECSDEDDTRSALSCPARFGMPIPVSNTFIHFPTANQPMRKRRSLSV